MKKINWKDLGVRAAKTFVQTFISYLTIDGLLGISDGDGLKRFALTTGLSALAAAISAVWNLILGVISEKAGEKLDQLGGETPSTASGDGAPSTASGPPSPFADANGDGIGPEEADEVD